LKLALVMIPQLETNMSNVTFLRSNDAPTGFHSVFSNNLISFAT
jgi:hypothetical protein